ncbi:MAG: FAD:protein FMN transferase [Cellulosilyticaceae bacterium]
MIACLKLTVKFICFIIPMSILLCSCQSPTNVENSSPLEPLRKTHIMMGTSVTITLYDYDDPNILDYAFEKIRQLESALSLNKSNTLLDKVNQQAGLSPVVVNQDFFNVVERGLYYSILTNGAFDVTIGPLVKLWNIGFSDARVPSEQEIDNILPLINYNNITLDATNNTIFLKNPNMKLDLGSIAKGYAADQIAELLRFHGVEHAIIDLGGNVYTLGSKLDGTSWKVGIQDPYNPRGAIIGHIPVSNKSIVTSGIYERFLKVDDASYHHILNPKDGYPYSNDIVSVTIISDYSVDGDALSTAVFSMGIEQGLNFVESLDGIEAIFISTDNVLYLTDGIKNDFTLSNDNFKLSSK